MLGFERVGQADLAIVGGKGANLGEMARAGLPVPPGFCVTTHAYRQALCSPGHGDGDGDGADDSDGAAGAGRFAALLDSLEAVPEGDTDRARTLAGELRSHIASQTMPPEIADAITAAWSDAGRDFAYAIRSSATAEDLPHASFAGQQDTYLNIVGRYAILERVRDCWASLFTDRAVLYRIKQGIPHRDVALCVVVQKMVHAYKSGILFTADPITGHRGVATIDAGWGLGESLVSGRVSADLYRVDRRSGKILEARLGDKKLAIRSAPGGGTRDESLDESLRRVQVLDDGEIAAVAELGDRIEALRGGPQDIEWCIEDGHLYAVQARPITSLYPLVPTAAGDDSFHTYFCLNHFQVMTDAMPPMALHIWRLMVPFGKDPEEVAECPIVHSAGGRLFIDMSMALRNGLMRRVILRGLAGLDVLAQAMTRAVIDRADLWARLRSGPRQSILPVVRAVMPRALSGLGWLLFRRPEGAAARYSAWVDGEIARIGRRLLARDGGAPLVDRVRASKEIVATFIWRLLRLPPIILAGALAGILLRKLTGRSAIELAPLGRGLSGNVTVEMDLAVGDLADCARRHPALRKKLGSGQFSLEELAELPGGDEFAGQLGEFLARYGSRGPSEIDVSRSRWREVPDSILTTVAGNLAHGEMASHRRHLDELAARADELGRQLVREARSGIMGFLRARLVARFVRVQRNLFALREHPKFMIVAVLDMVRTVALEAGAELVARDRLKSADDVFFLSLDELERALSDTAHGDDDRPLAPLAPLVAERRAKIAHYQSLYPPRVMTSDGEIPPAEHDGGDLPDGALAGSPASAGIVEGRARVITDPARQVLAKGEILIAPFTDPGWTPLFLNAAGLVMEVGGLMTHGSVVAREYGIPAVVCVPDATRLIQTGQRIRVHGDAGYVEILEDEPPS